MYLGSLSVRKIATWFLLPASASSLAGGWSVASDHSAPSQPFLFQRFDDRAIRHTSPNGLQLSTRLQTVPTQVTTTSVSSFSLPHEGSGEETRVISLDGLSLSEAIGIAIAHHPDISRANAEVAQRNAEVQVAKAAWYPKIDYGVKPGYGRSYSASSSGNAGALRTSVGVNQLIYDFGVTSNRIKAADAAREQTGHQLADAIESVAYNTAISFVDLAAAEDRILAAKTQVEALKATYAKIVDRVRAGLSVTSDRTLAELAIQRAEAEIEQEKTKRDVATAKLAELIGVRPKEVASLKDTVNMISSLDEPGDDVDLRPSVQAADAAVQAAEAKLEAARGSRYPSIGVGAMRTLSTGPASALNDTWVGVALSGSFNFGDMADHQIDAAQAAALASREALENERLITRSALQSARIEAMGASERMASYEKIINLAKTSRELYWQEYILNKRSLTDVLNPERDIYQSEIEWINALADRSLARIRAHVAVGRFVHQLRNREGNIHG